VKFFYFSNRHSLMAVIAAYIHLQKLPRDRKPSVQEILTIPEFDKNILGDYGVPYFIGVDPEKHPIYVIHFVADSQFALQTIFNILNQRGWDPSDWHFFNVSKPYNMLIKVGEIISSKFKVHKIGKYIAALGIQKSYFQLLKMVKSLKELKSGG
jgi:hypothetical protein